MPSSRPSLQHKVLCILAFAPLFAMAAGPLLLNARNSSASAAERELAPQSPESASQDPAQAPQPQASKYDKAIFQNPIPADQLAFLNHFAGSPSKNVVRDKQYRKLMRSVLLDCVFHYGWDMAPSDAFERVLSVSRDPVQIRDGRYVLVSGRNGPYLQGRAFMWIDIQEGIALGAFYFHPTNGEPTPTVTVFSRQIKEEPLKMSQLPPAFAGDLSRWSVEAGIPLATTRYFIGGSSKKILLEHDEDYCAPPDAAVSAADCEQMNADAADMDLNAAYYLEQTNHATNATAWMIVGPDQIAWIHIRDNTCRVRPDRLRCRIFMTRERTHVVIHRHPVPPPPRK